MLKKSPATDLNQGFHGSKMPFQTNLRSLRYLMFKPASFMVLKELARLHEQPGQSIEPALLKTELLALLLDHEETRNVACRNRNRHVEVAVRVKRAASRNHWRPIGERQTWVRGCQDDEFAVGQAVGA